MKSLNLNYLKKMDKSKKILILGIGFLLSVNSFSQTNTSPLPPSGNVGIGTTNPQAKIDIAVSSNSTSSLSGLRITSPSIFNLGTSMNSLFQIRKANIFGGGFHSLLFVNINENIGIGTDSPRSKLHVDDGRIQITGNNSYGGPMLLFGGDENNAPAGQWGIEYISTGVAGLNFWKPSGSNNFGNYFMFLADNGKVSIGLDPNHVNTFKGDFKLYVGQGIMTEKIKVAVHASGDWADYVFKEDYNLMSLSNVESFIAKNGHLPNLPSAEEVVETGIDMAKMDAKLLEKIEELTLYTINQQKTLDQLTKELNELKQK